MSAQTRPSSIHFSLDGDLAVAYGINEAFIIHHLQHWIKVNKKRGKNFKDGRTWTYQTLQEIADHFPFMNYEKVKYAIEKLEEQGVIIKGNYNKSKIDKTTWYAFAIEDIFVPDSPAPSKNDYERENSPSREDNPHRKGKFPHIPDNKTPEAKSTEDISLSRKREENREIFSEQPKPEQPSIDPLPMFDVPIDKKSDVTDKYSDEQIATALAVTNEKCSTTNLRARWKYFLNVLKSPPKKKESPYEELSQVFKNRKLYNHAICYIDKERITFERGRKHVEHSFGFFNWSDFEQTCSDFEINFKRKND